MVRRSAQESAIRRSQSDKHFKDDTKASIRRLTLCRDVRTRVSAGSTHLRASSTRVTLFSKLSVQRWNPRIPCSKSCRIILTDSSTPYVFTAASSCCWNVKGQTDIRNSSVRLPGTHLDALEVGEDVGRNVRAAEVGHTAEGKVILDRHDARNDRNGNPCREEAVSASPACGG